MVVCDLVGKEGERGGHDLEHGNTFWRGIDTKEEGDTDKKAGDHDSAYCDNDSGGVETC